MHDHVSQIRQKLISDIYSLKLGDTYHFSNEYINYYITKTEKGYNVKGGGKLMQTETHLNNSNHVVTMIVQQYMVISQHDQERNRI